MNYRHFEETLAGLVRDYSAAQWHGLLCGLICAGRPVNTETWFDCAMTFSGESGTLPVETGSVLKAVFERTRGQLSDTGEDMEFDLLLPDEDTPLELRADALKLWCEGFLHGLSAGGLARNVQLSADSTEFLRDLAEFCKLGHIGSEEATDSDEFYLMELIEYVRAGVLLLHDELNDNSGFSQTLH
jgi:uncharacterized protein YgfB (UPF0149 family)